MSHEEFPLVIPRKAVQFLRFSSAFKFFSEWSPKITAMKAFCSRCWLSHWSCITSRHLVCSYRFH